MRINADFSQRVVVRPENAEWVPSPESGVERLMLDRIGDEVARATSLVRFAPGSSFSEHVHGGGEEFLVLEGVFSDETGDFPAGSYVRNPIGTRHSPHTIPGCTIFVKLHQFDPQDQLQTVIDTTSAAFSPGDVDGVSVLPLHETETETVTLERWQPGARFKRRTHRGGEEILVIRGTLRDEHGDYPERTWIRNPHLAEHTPFSDDGCLIYVKTGHLGTR